MNDPMMQPTRIYIDGVWEKGRGEVLESLNPATGEVHWSGHAANRDDVDAAVQAAASALPDWSALSLPERIECVESFGRQLETAAEELTEVISRETGKVRWDASGEVAAMRAKIPVSISALQERRSPAEISLNNMTGRTRYKPLGVTAVFGPFNFPGHISNGHIIPALLAGNTIVFKPSELAPASAAAMVHLWDEAGLPPGVLNLVQGGKETGSAVVEHPWIRGLFFTGSVRVGKMISRALADRLDVLVALELGGNNPLVVDRPHSNAAAVYDVIRSAFLTAGQRCTCARRLIVVDGNDEFLGELVEATRQIQIGLPDADPPPFLGPLIHETAAIAVISEQERLQAHGGRILLAAKRLSLGQAFVSPGIVDVTEVVNRDDDEVFGPLLQVIRVPDLDAAIEEANRTQFGLVAAIFTQDRERYEQFYNQVEAGLVNWNCPTNGASGKLPFGGVKMSGNHRPAGYFTTDFCNSAVASLEQDVHELPAQRLPGL